MLHETQHFNFVLKGGGIGDNCAQQAALKWIADTKPHVHATIFTPQYFQDIPENIFKNKVAIENVAPAAQCNTCQPPAGVKNGK